MTVTKPKDYEPQTRYQTLQVRTEVAKEGLLADIEIWSESLADNRSINFHIGQFKAFCQRVFDQLQGRSEEDILFKSRVVGGLTSQWLVLREVAALRLAGSPYLVNLDELDQEATQYYRAVRQSLPDSARKFVPSSPPLVSLGRSAEFFLFNNQDQTPPAIINIPFGAVYDSSKSRSRLALAHEVGHAIFNRIQPCLSEMESTVKAVLSNDSSLMRQQQVIHRVIMPWLSEMVADLTGTALSGPDFGHSALSMVAGPEAYLSLTDETHPIPVIRPYIHLEFLEYLDEKTTPEQADILKDYLDGVGTLQESIEVFSKKYLSRRFEAVPALTQVTLSQVRDEMLAITRLMLKNELGIFEGKSFGAILIDCAVKMKQPQESVSAAGMPPQEWGNTIEIGSPLVLDFSHMVSPSYAVPVTMGDILCDYFGIC